jgi:acetate kinase
MKEWHFGLQDVAMSAPQCWACPILCNGKSLYCVQNTFEAHTCILNQISAKVCMCSAYQTELSITMHRIVHVGTSFGSPILVHNYHDLPCLAF